MTQKERMTKRFILSFFLVYSPIGPCPMQLVTPSVVAMAVNIEMANCRIIFQISFFIS